MGVKKRKHYDYADAKRNGAIAAGSTLTALTTRHVVKEAAREAKEIARVGNSGSFDSFLKTLKPGDILFSRSTRKNNAFVDVKHMLQGGMGSRHYHASVFIGKGRIAEHPGATFKSWMPHARVQLSRGEDVVAYRPKVADEIKKQAVERVKALHNRPYASHMDIISTGFRNALGLPPKVLGAKPGSPITCVTMPQTGYKELFGKRFTGIAEMRAHPDMEMVSRLQRAGTDPKLGEKALYRVGYGVLKNAKWAILAGALAIGATAFLHYMKNKKTTRGAKSNTTPKAKAKPSAAGGAVRFIRVHGRVIPIRKR